MRLIHYSVKPLIKVRSMPYAEHGAGAYKTPGLWVSIEGEDDWLAWCRAESFGLGRFKCATEVILADSANVKHLSGSADIDWFTAEFRCENKPSYWRGLNWPAIRERWQGLIIAPYCWERRLSEHTSWYYGWDCASGVIWDAKAIKELRVTDPPNMTEEAAA